MHKFTIFFCLALIVAVALCQDAAKPDEQANDANEHNKEKNLRDHPHPHHDGAGKDHHDHEHDHTTTPSTAAP
uniref:Secreted protein n=1 Tax=Steinernema glaseri TaxID=37863 RepID=A0A1I7YTL9_9BILA